MASRWEDRRNETRDPNESDPSPEKSPSHAYASDNSKVIGPKSYSYSELAQATGHFSLNYQIGQGGFGQVFKASLNGKIRAIKKLNNFVDVQPEGKLENEIKVVNRVSHKNLVKLAGYCIDGANRLLILKYFSNGSLRSKLHGKENVLDWKKRMKIAIGSAKGLQYLHEDCEPKIIHLDVKADNILLDDNFEPKVSDFGLSLFFSDAASHVSRSSIRGTQIYADPLTTQLGKHSDKSDVYSFGVTLLELISGRKPIDQKGVSIVIWANSLIEKALKGEYADFVDSRLQSFDQPFDYEEMHRIIFCVNACINLPPESRPSMKRVALALEGILPLKNDNKLYSGVSYKDEVKPSLKPPINQETNKPSSKPPVIQETNQIVVRKGRSTSRQPTEARRFTFFRQPTEATSNGSSNNIGETSFEEKTQVYKPRRFTYFELTSATRGFAENNLLNRGPLGKVYKSILDYDEPVIVKKLYIYMCEGKEDEFKKIKDISTSVHDKNVVNLIGYCDDGDKRLLVYEYFPYKSSLRSHLDGNGSLDWPTRMEIAIRIGRGLVNLHDLYKPWNVYEHYKDNSIFLDENFQPKFAEYKRDKFFSKDSGNSIPRSSMSSRYVKLDVYFFGVILLEMITGKLPDLRSHDSFNLIEPDLRSHDSFNLIEWAIPTIQNDWPEGNYKFVDKKLGKNFDEDEMDRMIECALACVERYPQNRPEMSKVVEVLAENIPRKNLKN